MPETGLAAGKVRFEEGAVTGLEGDGVGVAPAELRPGPEVRLKCAPELVVRRSLDDVVCARQPVHGEAPGDGLLVERVGVSGQGVQFAGLRLTFGADDVLHSGEVQQIAEFGGVEEAVGADCRFVSGF